MKKGLGMAIAMMQIAVAMEASTYDSRKPYQKGPKGDWEGFDYNAKPSPRSESDKAKDAQRKANKGYRKNQKKRK